MSNNINFVGQLAADAELRALPNGTPVLGFRVANNIWKRGAEQTNWFACSIIGDRANKLHPMMKKGTKVAVTQADLFARPWTDKTGAEKISLDVDVRQLEILSKAGGQDVPADDIPF